MLKKYSLIFAVIFLVSGCAGTVQNRSKSEKLTQDVRAKKYDDALRAVKDKNFYPQDNSVLLRKLEVGTVHYLKGDYYQALKYFESAKKISDDLYTKSIKKVMASGWDANLDDYFGERYERSMIRFYLSLINYDLFRQGFYEEYTDEKTKKKVDKKELTDSERRFHLSYARSVIIEWDSLLQSMQNESMGLPVYKNDMLAKVWGAFIHSELENSNDRQIAIQLYRDADDLLLRGYNMYPIFNNKSVQFNDDFKKLSVITYQQLLKNYVESTEYSKELQEFISRNRRNLERRKPDNVVIMLKDDLISAKKVNTFELPLPIAAFGSQGSDLYEVARAIMSTKEGMPYVVVEFPEIKRRTELEVRKYTAVIYNSNGDEIAKTNLTLIEPLSDIAKKTLDDKILYLRTAIIARITTKYVAAVTAAYALYSQDSPFAKIGAMAMFAASAKTINETSRADIRYWATLASDVQMGGFRMEPGKYRLEILSEGKKIYEREISVKNGETSFVDLNF